MSNLPKNIAGPEPRGTRILSTLILLDLIPF